MVVTFMRLSAIKLINLPLLRIYLAWFEREKVNVD